MNWNELIKTSDAKALVPTLSATAKTTLKYLSGDYWQGMDAWAGTRPPHDAANRAEAESELERMFVPQPLIEEATGRHVDGVVGHEPAFEYLISRDRSDEETFVECKRRIDDYLEKIAAPIREQQRAQARKPVLVFLLNELIREAKNLLGFKTQKPPSLTDLPEEIQQVWLKGEEFERLHAEEDKRVAQTNAAIGAWWDKRKGHETTREFASQLVATGRGALRLWVPSGLLSEGGVLSLPAATKTDEKWRAALDAIYFECPAPESAAVVIDRATMKPVSLFVYKETITRDGKEEEFERVEVSYVNEAGKTVIRILEGDVILEDGGEAIQDIGGELYVDVAEMPPLISVPAQKLQNAHSVMNSMTLKNGDLAGFRERNYINLQRPKKAVPDPDDPDKTILEDADVEVGADAANFLTGITYKDNDGNTKIANGAVIISEPVSPAPLIAAIEQFERGFYRAVSQLHVLISGDATASAVSRVQARADFITSLLKTKPKIEGVLRSRLRAVLLLAAFLADDEERLKQFKELRVRVDCRLDPGPMTPEEKLALVTLYEKRLISRETAQVMIGIEDVTGEASKLQDEEEGSLEYLKQQADITQIFAAAGAGIYAAALAAGIDAEIAERMARSDFADEEEEETDEQ